MSSRLVVSPVPRIVKLGRGPKKATITSSGASEKSQNLLLPIAPLPLGAETTGIGREAGFDEERYDRSGGGGETTGIHETGTRVGKYHADSEIGFFPFVGR